MDVTKKKYESNQANPAPIEPLLMRLPRTFPTLRSSRNPLVTFGLIFLVVYAAYESAQIILADDLPTLAYVAIVFFGGAVVIAILNDWRRGLYILVGWILFEDIVRKYLGNNMAIYFVKDILAIILYLSFFRARLAKQIVKFRIPFRLPLMIFFWFCLLQMFNPASPSIFYGILGMKLNFLYIPLIYIGYAFAESEEELQRFLSFNCVLILIVAGLGMAQSIIGPTFLNPQNLQEDIRSLSTLYRVAPTSGLMAYRPTSVFVSSGRFQDFLIVAWLFSLGYGGYVLLRTRRGRTLAFTTIGAVAGASVLSASRGVFMWNAGITLVLIAGFLWGAPWRQREAVRVLRVIQRTALLIGLVMIFLLTIFPEALGSRIAIYTETLMPNSPTSELVQRTRTYPLQQLEFAFANSRWPIGYGIGTCSLGWQYVIRITGSRPISVGVENGFGNVLLELGIVGLILWIVLGFLVATSAWVVVKTLRGTPWFPLGLATFFFAVLIFFLMMFFGNSPYQDFVINSSLWLQLGVLFRLRGFPEATQTTMRNAASGRS